MASRAHTETSESDDEIDDDSDIAAEAQRPSTPNFNPPAPLNGSRNHRDYDNDDDALEVSDDEIDKLDPRKFQRGAIVRVKLTNFVTYENAEFFPGPSLNMVIGPNGTGKSSLVCALCLGLGWGPQHLGRASQFAEFVKHNKSDAFIETELQGANGKPNDIVRLRIIRENNSREWWLNGKRSSLKAVKNLTDELSIQIDNLCQFLPQDKVAEFSALSPVDLLRQTQRAAASPEMLKWHEELNKMRQIHQQLQMQIETDANELKTQETRQNSLHSEIAKLQERNQIKQRVDLLRKQVPFIEYKIAVDKHNIAKKQKATAHQQYKDLEAQIAPTLRHISNKEAYATQVQAVVSDRKQKVREIEAQALKFITAQENLQEEISSIEAKIESGSSEMKAARDKISTSQKKITNWQNQLEQRPVEFDATEWNERIRIKEQDSRQLKSQLEDLNRSHQELKVKGHSVRANIDEAKQELVRFDSQEGQLMSKLEKESKDTAEAWKWILDHQGDFEMEVCGPPLITCFVKNPEYTALMEALIPRNDLMMFTTQTTADFKKLSNQLQGVFKFRDVTIRRIDNPTVPAGRPLSIQDMQRYGMLGWAIDQLDGPGPVLAMLCECAKLDRSAIASQDISEHTYATILREEKINQWVTNTTRYNVMRRREYGPDAVSTNTKPISPAKLWTNQPVDVSARKEIEDKIAAFDAEMNGLRQNNTEFKECILEVKEKVLAIQTEIESVKNEKSGLQKAYNAHKGLPGRILNEQDNLKKAREHLLACREKYMTYEIQYDHVVLQKAKASMEHKDHVSKIRTAHEELLEAQIRSIEAESDVVGLTKRNGAIVQQRDEEQRKLKEIDEEAKKVKAVATRNLEICKRLLDDPENEQCCQLLSNPGPETTVESLEMDIAAEESKLEYLVTNNPQAIQQFEDRQKKIEELNKKIADTEDKLQKVMQRITNVRNKWEPGLDKLIATISEAFSFNFEQIGCAGEVSINKDDDFENWSIQIKVKFRENESLQILDQHRQSGGERSVSTIFYLMALQSLATSPFRVVDEINQGMDPRNERMVHERMVDIACKEYTSQYFLITPKLLTGLRYDRRMKVLCIASGPYMPEDHNKLDISKIIQMKRAIMASN